MIPNSPVDTICISRDRRRRHYYYLHIHNIEEHLLLLQLPLQTFIFTRSLTKKVSDQLLSSHLFGDHANDKTAPTGSVHRQNIVVHNILYCVSVIRSVRDSRGVECSWWRCLSHRMWYHDETVVWSAGTSMRIWRTVFFSNTMLWLLNKQ